MPQYCRECGADQGNHPLDWRCFTVEDELGRGLHLQVPSAFGFCGMCGAQAPCKCGALSKAEYIVVDWDNGSNALDRERTNALMDELYQAQDRFFAALQRIKARRS